VENVPDTDKDAVEFEQIELVGPVNFGLDVFSDARAALLGGRWRSSGAAAPPRCSSGTSKGWKGAL
jgi:hypothetical protein